MRFFRSWKWRSRHTLHIYWYRYTLLTVFVENLTQFQTTWWEKQRRKYEKARNLFKYTQPKASKNRSKRDYLINIGRHNQERVVIEGIYALCSASFIGSISHGLLQSYKQCLIIKKASLSGFYLDSPETIMEYTFVEVCAVHRRETFILHAFDSLKNYCRDLRYDTEIYSGRVQGWSCYGLEALS